MAYKHRFDESTESIAANDTYVDMLSSYSTVDKSKAKLADNVRSEFIDLGSEAKNLVDSMDIFSVNGYKSTIQKIIDIDREMSRKLAGLAKIDIFPF